MIKFKDFKGLNDYRVRPGVLKIQKSWETVLVGIGYPVHEVDRSHIRQRKTSSSSTNSTGLAFLRRNLFATFSPILSPVSAERL